MSKALLVRQIIAALVICFVAWGFFPVSKAPKVDVDWSNATEMPR